MSEKESKAKSKGLLLIDATVMALVGLAGLLLVLALVVALCGVHGQQQQTQQKNGKGTEDAGGSYAHPPAQCTLPQPAPNSISTTLMQQGYTWVRNVDKINKSTVRPFPLRRIRCIVSDRFKFVFHHILKSGGSSMSARLKLAIGGVVPAHKPGDPFPEKTGQLPHSRRGDSWLRLTNCNDQNTQDYLHFSTVRDPFDRLKSVRAFAQFHRQPGRSYPRAIPSLETLATARDPEAAFMGSTPMGKTHAVPQYAFLLGDDDKWAVDFIADLKSMPMAMQEHVIPVLKARLAGSGIDTSPLDTLAQYFGDNTRVNVMKKPKTDSNEETRLRCLLYQSPAYKKDYQLLYSTHEAQRWGRANDETRSS